MRISVTNHIETATITVSSEQSSQDFGKENLKLATELDLPWKTTATGEQWAVFDHGTAKPVGRWAFLATNYMSARIQANATNTWTEPSYDAVVELDTNHRGTGRICAEHAPLVAQSYRYNRWLIPSQSTTDGASYYRTGVITAGPLLELPRGLFWGPKTREVDAIADVLTVSKRRQRSILGPRLFTIAGKIRLAGFTAPTRDEIKALNEVLHAWKDKGYATVSFLSDDEHWVHVMQMVNEINGIDDLPAETDIELEEIA